MEYDYADKFTFTCEWYEEDADTIRELCLHFYPYDNTVQVLDVGRQKKFMKRVFCPFLKLEMLQIGATVRLFSRLLLIKDCAPATRRHLFGSNESTFALIKPMPASKYGKIFDYLGENGFQIRCLKKAKVDKNFALIMYKRISNHPKLPVIIDYMTSGEVVGMELVADNAIRRWRDAIGVREPSEAAPGTLRRMYGENIVKNLVHGATNQEEVTDCMNSFFGTSFKKTIIPIKAAFRNCTCCIIKPHAIVEGSVGHIMNMITAAKFQVSSMAMFSLDIVNAEEFYEVYKNVLSEHKEMAAQLSEGNCIVLEILGEDSEKDCVCAFRQLYPDTLRGRFGRDVVHNAVHCTDLPEDGVLEVEYFFKLLLW